MADKPKANGSATKKPWGTDVGSIGNKAEWKKVPPSNPTKKKSNPTPNGGK